MELLAKLLTFLGHFQSGIYREVLCEAPGVFPYCLDTLLVGSVHRSHLWSSRSISIIVAVDFE